MITKDNLIKRARQQLKHNRLNGLAQHTILADIMAEIMLDILKDLKPNNPPKLSINPVVQQRELLEAFKHILEMKYGNLQFDDYDIECFIKGLQ